MGSTTKRRKAKQQGQKFDPARPAWAVLNADCVQVMRECSIVADLIFADPPFNIGQEYSGYTDRIHPHAFSKFMSSWIGWAVDCLADRGTLCIHVPDELVTDVEMAIRSRGLTRVDWIIWHYRFGQCGRSKFINSKAHCLVYVRDPRQRTWNPDAVLVESDRVKYGDKRTEDSLTPGKRVPLDVWGIGDTFSSDGYPGDGPYWGRVQGNNAERQQGCPNQLPEVYLERIVRAFSNVGDLVFDPFTGSGTTGVAAVSLGRRFIGCEIGEKTVKVARERIAKGAVRVKRK